MAKVPIAEVKQVWCAALRALPELVAVNIHPAWPGEDLLYTPELNADIKAAIWFGPSVCTYERHSMRADRQRRLVTCTFPVIIEVLVAGVGSDADMEYPAGLLAEQYAYDLWQPIDEHVADEKHLSSPSLVESAVVDGEDVDAGFTDTGYGYRLSMPIISKFRLL